MIQRNFRTYIKFLSRNKLYSLVTIFGFSISLMFVIILGVYIKQELSVDGFHEKKDRIYLMMHDKETNFGNPVAEKVKDNFPEVEAFVRLHSRSALDGAKGENRTRVKALFADSTFFNVFSFPLIEGDPSKVLVGDKTVVLTESYVNKHFAKENPIGKQIYVDEHQFTVTGIMKDIPKNTQIPEADYVASYPNIQLFWGFPVIDDESNYGFTMYFLEKENADLPARSGDILEKLKKESWYYMRGYTEDLHFTKLQDAYFEVDSAGYLDLRTSSMMLIVLYSIIAIVILVIATFNYINMTVAQSSFRGKETAIKKILGSSRKAIIGQILLESLMMTTATFLLGLFFAFLVEGIAGSMLSTQLRLTEQFTPFTIAVSVVFVLCISFASGIIPAQVISRFDPLDIVKGGFSRKQKTIYSQILIVFQYTVAIILLIGTFFISKQTDFMINYELGYNQNNIYTYESAFQSRETAEGFRSKLLAISGVENVSFSSGTPFDIYMNNMFEVDGKSYNLIKIMMDEQFTNVYGIDIRPTGVAVGDKVLYLNDYGAKQFDMDTKDFTVRISEQEKIQVAGLLNDIHIRSLHSGKDPIGLFPLPADWGFAHISIKFAKGVDAYALAKRIDKEYFDYLGGVPMDGKFVDDVVQQWYEREQKTSKIISVLTYLTILISVMGVFAMSLYLIRQKEKEIGIRKVNGATEIQVLVMLNKESLIRVLIAFVIACPIAYYAINKWLQSFSYRIAMDWWIFIIAGAIIALLTLVSVSYMTWKAATANPVDTLKSE